MSLTDQQRETLARALKSSRKVLKKYQMDDLRGNLHINLQLYQEEKDKEGIGIYQPLVNLVDKVESLEEVEELLKS
jgi:hypothetical protein